MNEYGFKIISQVEAKKIMDTEECVILDVRTPEEFEEKHIFNATLVPLDKVEANIENVIPDKNAKILVYCRSGKRSKDASYIM
ncbi:MAG: rhodanese-like domain-containing protein, partial [Eubacteriales bacterium]|nr:rhodanese-like domain-containing protein [Eubacteriales bacterium]